MIFLILQYYKHSLLETEHKVTILDYSRINRLKFRLQHFPTYSEEMFFPRCSGDVATETRKGANVVKYRVR